MVSDYKHAYLLELRAKLVEDSPVACTKRLFEFRQKMSAELRSYLKGLPEREQPTTLEETYAAIRRWIEKERAAKGESDTSQAGRGRFRRRGGGMNELKEDEAPKPEAMQAMINQSVQQALAKAGVSGKGGGGKGSWGGKPTTAPPELKKCERCKGMHVPRLTKEQCPNRGSLKAGTLKQILDSGKKCSYWVRRAEDGTKTECGGEGHTWEDHKAALAEAYPKGKEGGKKGGGKKGGGRGDKKPKESTSELREVGDQDHGQQEPSDLRQRLLTEFTSVCREDGAGQEGPVTESDIVDALFSGDVGSPCCILREWPGGTWAMQRGLRRQSR